MNDVAVEHAPDAATEPKQKRSLLLPLLIGGLVLSVAAAATFVALWAQEKETSPEEVATFLGSQEAEVQTVAAEVINLLSNYDASNIEQVAARMLEISTGNFRTDYEETFAAGLGGALEEVEASTRGQIMSGPDISFRTASEAVAIARVTETVQNKEIPTGRTFEYLMEITLIDTVDGGWKADRVEILSGKET
jgi:uncharacterized protein (UPF0333 family)